MKIEIKHILKLIVLSFYLLPVWTWAADYNVSTSTSTVDGDTFCGGSACTSSDTIIIEGSARGDLLFRDFDGSGSYITIQNETANRVIITSNGGPGAGILTFEDCKYIDVRGDNNSSFTWTSGCKEAECYGIKVVNDGSPSTPVGNVWVRGESDNIKLSYIETDHDGATGQASVGLKVGGDTGLTSAWTYDTFEIHHNYFHDTRYHAMYLGHDRPHYTGTGQNCADGCPYVANFSIHDNIMENLGASGFIYKGVKDGSYDYIYNNIIQNTGIIPAEISNAGISVSYFYGTAYAEIYYNWVEKTYGPGMNIREANHLIHDNTVVGCGTSEDTRWAQGIYVQKWDSIPDRPSRTIQIYQNTIVEAERYGISDNSGNNPSAFHYRNIIAESGLGEVEEDGSNLTEGTGANANIYEADADDVGFKIWIDDGDYSNDDFSLNYKNTGLSVTGGSIN